MSKLSGTDLTDLIAGIADDGRDLVKAQVSVIRSDLGDLGAAIKSWLIAVFVAIVTTVLFGVALAATLTEVGGLPWYGSLWVVTGLAIGLVVALVLRARMQARRAARQAAADVKQVLHPGAAPAHH